MNDEGMGIQILYLGVHSFDGVRPTVEIISRVMRLIILFLAFTHFSQSWHLGGVCIWWTMLEGFDVSLALQSGSARDVELNEIEEKNEMKWWLPKKRVDFSQYSSTLEANILHTPNDTTNDTLASPLDNTSSDVSLVHESVPELRRSTRQRHIPSYLQNYHHHLSLTLTNSDQIKDRLSSGCLVVYGNSQVCTWYIALATT
ncbi:hypothetical protein RJ641_028405 [Dillenia turbinata]|uniref:Uncharacterized protein n=1 Tax=Dillenia turbinata TaxID=194707 RepID=A0AAN8VY79_9MAGN